MSNTVDRVPPPAPLVKAADHSADHNPRQQHHSGPEDDEPPAATERAAAAAAAADESPAVVLDTGPHPGAALGGVAAYQATARHAMEALAMEELGRAPQPGPSGDDET